MHGGAITELLQRHHLGDREAFDQVVPLVYDYLRRIARSQLARGWPSDTLDTTALVHEAYLQLAAETGLSVKDRNHFYAICARVMRRILVDHARRVSAQKRSADGPRVPLDFVDVGVDAQTEVMVAVDEALTALHHLDEQLVRVVECRYFAGMTETETAAALDMSLRSVQRHWLRARAWLLRELGTAHDYEERAGS